MKGNQRKVRKAHGNKCSRSLIPPIEGWLKLTLSILKIGLKNAPSLRAVGRKQFRDDSCSQSSFGPASGSVGFVSVPVFSGAVLEPELTATLCLNTISPPSHPEIVINTTPLKIGDWTTRKLLRDPN